MRRAVAGLALAVAVVCAADAAPPAGSGSPMRIDDFEDISGWTAHPAEGVTVRLAADAGARGRALRMDVRFARGTGYAVARRPVALELPADYVFRFQLRGEIPVNHLEFKLVDSTGENVWWHVRRDLEFPREWRTISTRRRQIRFAWGPAGGGEIRRVGFIEIAVTAGEGGEGSVWLDDLVLEPLELDSTLPRVRARASSESRGGEAARAVDGHPGSAWRSAAGDSRPWIELDLGRVREFGGLDLRWAPGRHLRDYLVELSLDGRSWTGVDTVHNGNGGRDPLYLPESEARLVRVRALSGAPGGPVGLREAIVQPVEWSVTPEAFFTHLAREAPRGAYPRPYVGEQCAWAVVGSDGGREEALLSEDGMLETGKRRYSIEPFLRVNGRLITWADVTTRQSLDRVEPPIPTVHWRHPDVELTITASVEEGVHADSARPQVVARYRARNPRSQRLVGTLYLAARPFQVNPPWQNIGFPGGTARIHRIEPWEDGGWRVDDRWVVSSRGGPSAFGAAGLDQGDLVEFLMRGELPEQTTAEDVRGFAAAALAFDLAVPPGGERVVELRVPLDGPAPAGSSGTGATPAPPRAGGGAHLRLSAAPDVEQTVRAQIGWILVNRDGGAIQPGSRNYDRSWIRDGSLTSSALLRMGYPEVVREFIEWFAPFQYENGKIPCCASDRGPDPVTENDSHGQFIWLVADYYRHSGDRRMVERMWPRVAAAVAHMDSLRGERRTDAWRARERRKFFGLLLPSISHEGYAHPVHSYWDDFFAYRGYADAAYLAEVLGREEDRSLIAAARDTFGGDLAASIAATMAEKAIDYLPGCAELGDFDATSTTVALVPTEAADLLPEAAIRRTFERYWEFFRDRRDGRRTWEAYTPYEMRTIGSFVRLGWRRRAEEALRYFMGHRQPAGWRQWAEVVHRDPRAPRYIGDMPHTWVGSDFVRSVLDMLAYERGRDSALVVGAGVPWRWIGRGDTITVRDLGSLYGPLGFTMRARGDTVHVALAAGMRVPPGGIVIVPPARRPFRRATVNGEPAPLTREGGALVRALPARVELWP